MFNILRVAEENHSFLHHYIRYIFGYRIKQFINISSSYITKDNIYKLAQRIELAAKIIYVNQNLIVVKEGNKLLTTNGVAIIIYTNIRELNDVFKHPDLSSLIDFAEPVGVLIIYITYFLTDIELTHIILSIRSTICDGSYVTLIHNTLDSHLIENENIADI